MAAGDIVEKSDQDVRFDGVAARAEGEVLPAGMVASAINLVFSGGVARMRPSVCRPHWGGWKMGRYAGSGLYDVDALGVLVEDALPASWVGTDGRTYERIVTDITGATVLADAIADEGEDRLQTEEGKSLLLEDRSQAVDLGWVLRQEGPRWLTSKASPTEGEYFVEFDHLGRAPMDGAYRSAARWNDPEGIDAAIVVTDELTVAGGRGRAYWVVSGNAGQAVESKKADEPSVEVPLNGHDVWGVVRLVQAFNGMLMLRQGNRRAYFQYSDVNGTTYGITFHADYPFHASNRVRARYVAEDGACAPLVNGVHYWLKRTSGERGYHVYESATAASVIPLEQPASGRFYFEMDDPDYGVIGNWAPPLLMQPDYENGVVVSATEAGFDALPAAALVTAGSGTTLTVPNHRLENGDEITFSTPAIVTPDTGSMFAHWINDHQISVHDDLPKALLGDTKTARTVSWRTGVTVSKFGSSAMAMPGGREAIEVNSRIILVVDRDTVFISDVGDPLHCSAWTGALRINRGEADLVTGFALLGKNAVLVFKRNKIYIANNPDDPATTDVSLLTDEYGCIAPLSICTVGQDVWFLSNKGVGSVRLTEQSEQVGVAIAKSVEIGELLRRVDYAAAETACAVAWEDRYYLAAPLLGQETPVNNAVFTYNFENQKWEGYWQSEYLNPVVWWPMTVYGEEKLCWLDAGGFVAHFGAGTTDDGLAIETELVTRPYYTDDQGGRFWQRFEFDLSTWAPTFDLAVRVDGGEYELESGKQFARNRWMRYGAGPWDASNADGEWGTRGREDYSVALVTASPLHAVAGGGVTLFRHQDHTRTKRRRVEGRAVQLVVRGREGSVRLRSTRVFGLAGRLDVNE